MTEQDNFWSFGDETAPVTMGTQDYFKKSQDVLNRIASAHGGAYSAIPLKESEFPNEDICDKCTGCGRFKEEDGTEKQCWQDHVEGECFKQSFDAEGFAEEIENIIPDVWELISIEQLKP